jgi:ribonuclease HI
MLAPLTSLVGECGHTKITKAKKTKKRPWYWDEVHQKAFDDVKAIIAKEVVLAYPDYSKEFEIYTDASSKQLGSVITQGNRPLAFFSRKLSATQQKYSVTELELLAIVETLKEFKGMLWGQRLKVYTDHKNLIQDALGLTSDRVYRWRLLLEEFGPEIVYIKGIHNTVADAISRLDFGPIQNNKNNWMTFTKCWCHNTTQEESVPNTSAHQDQMNLVFANRSEEDAIYPFTVREIAQAQKFDVSLEKLTDNIQHIWSRIPTSYARMEKWSSL